MQLLFIGFAQLGLLAIEHSLLPFMCHHLAQNALRGEHTNCSFGLFAADFAFKLAVLVGIVVPKIFRDSGKRQRFVFLTVCVQRPVALLVLAILARATKWPIGVHLVVGPVALFGAGLGVGVGEAMVAEWLARQCTKVANKRTWMIKVIFLCLAFGPFVTGFLLHNGPGFVGLNEICLIRFIRMEFALPGEQLLVGLAIFQLALIPEFHVFCAEVAPAIPLANGQENMPKSTVVTPPKCLRQFRLKLRVLAAILALFSTALADVFPQFLFAVDDSAQFSSPSVAFATFCTSALFGVFLLIVHGTKLSPNATIAIGLIGTGCSVCALKLAASLQTASIAFYGTSLALVVPAIAVYMSGLPNDLVETPSNSLIQPILFGRALAPVLFSIPLTQMFSRYGSKMFTSVCLLEVLAMVVAFVVLLDVQAEMMVSGMVKITGAWHRFFRGEGPRRATRRSIQMFVKGVQGSIRRGYGSIKQKGQLIRRIKNNEPYKESLLGESIEKRKQCTKCYRSMSLAPFTVITSTGFYRTRDQSQNSERPMQCVNNPKMHTQTVATRQLSLNLPVKNFV